MSRLLLPLLVLLPTLASAQQWTAERALQFGKSDRIVFESIMSIAVGSDGSVDVLDAGQAKVFTFKSTGELVRSFGTRGTGPGEFSQYPAPVLAVGEYVVVVDRLSRRIYAFKQDGTLAHTRYLDLLTMSVADWVAVGNRVAYVQPAMPASIAAAMGGVTKPTVVAFDPGSDAVADTLLRIDLPSGIDVDLDVPTEFMATRMDMRTPTVKLASDGRRVLVATSDKYRIRVLDGTAESWLGRDVSPYRYTEAERAEMKQRQDSVMQEGRKQAEEKLGRAPIMRPSMEFIMPTHAPAISSIIAGDRFVLVASGHPKDVLAGYDVIGYDNTLLGTLKLLVPLVPLLLRGDLLYGYEKDSAGAVWPAVYRLRPPRS